jgi:hypothetical protein
MKTDSCVPEFPRAGRQTDRYSKDNREIFTPPIPKIKTK